MKRVTILVDDIGEPDGDGERLLIGTRPGTEFDTYVAADRIISIEDHVEPLPTEPGTRFWGRLGDDEPQWWFARRTDAILYYLPGLNGQIVNASHAQAYRLVRLPDPGGRPQ